jgi:L-alanine-DL-glutamate epimerase-like enolase superfamily enzyme
VNPNNLAESILKEPVTIKNGIVRVPEAIGLGVEVDEDAIAKFLIK